MASTLIDSNIFIALANKRDGKHSRAIELLRKLVENEYGQPYTSDYILDEAVTTCLFRTARLDFAINVGKMILGSKEESISPFAKLLKVSDKSFAEAWESFESGRFKGLSFTDYTVLVQIKESGMDSVTSFDSGFDGLVLRNS